MSHVQFQIHRSRKIFVLDFTEAYTAEQFNAVAEEAKKVAILHKSKSLLVLVDFTDYELNANGRKDLSDLVSKINPYIQYMAIVVEFHFWQEATLKVRFFFTGQNKLRLFRDKKTAMGWLANP
jgi:hypothetical protein